MSDVANSEVYQFKVRVRRISPMIWRHLLVPEELPLTAPHRTIQIAFGWGDYHFHAFELHGRHHGTTRTGERHRDATGCGMTLADLRSRVRQRIRHDYGDL